MKQKIRNKLRVPDEIVGFIRGAHPQLKRKIKAALNPVLTDPDLAKSLRDDLKGLRTFTVSRFRTIYRIWSNNYIEVVAIGPRKTIYEETFRIIARKKGSAPLPPH